MSADTSHTSEDFSDIDMDELDSYLTSPPVRPADPPRSRDARVARPRAVRLLRGIALGPRTSTASFQIVSSDRVEADRGDASIPPSVTPRLAPERLASQANAPPTPSRARMPRPLKGHLPVSPRTARHVARPIT